MGVHGLWKLLEPSGQMVPLESLAGKVLAVDVSIWLHQAVKGIHDTHGAPLAVAHLLILFHRVCKLLFYKIKPVFVFDGGVPALKRQTVALRRQKSSTAKNEAMKVRQKLIKNLLKHEAVRHMLSDETASAALGLNSFTLPGPSVEEDLYKLPPIAADLVDSEESDVMSSSDEEKQMDDIHSIDVNSAEFLSLPAEVRHDILTELIETRKQSSWKYLESMPKKSDSFSDFQMNRLLKRHAVQNSLEKAGKEMGGRALSLKELESLLGEQGVLDPKVDLPSRRIAQDSVTRYMLVQKDSKPDLQFQEKFDIMNHLEEVEYSSESDTDVILKNPSGQPLKNTLTNKELSYGSRKPKVVITKEVADILSVLEDKDVAEDVKVKLENLQSKIQIAEDLKSSSKISHADSAIKYNSVKEEANFSVVEKEKDFIPYAVSDIEKILEDDHKKSRKDFNSKDVGIKPVKDTDTVVKTKTETLSENLPTNSISDFVNSSNILLEPFPSISAAVEEKKNVCTPEMTTIVKEIEDSSSGSENDFISINSENSASKNFELNLEKENKKDVVTVVINPLDSSTKDDLFADVFESAPLEITENVTRDEKSAVIKEGTEVLNDFQMSNCDFSEWKKKLEEQQVDLLKEHGKQERMASNMTDSIYTDAQELLKLFGIPYIVAPMEAEAQCATLDMIGLTEGTITDDSDIWLFGGQVVYKNFFNQQKHVLEYRSENIRKHFKLTREEMIKIALLVGSDYTVGLNGIGPVTALEIIANFHSPNRELLGSLLKFRDWYMGTAKGEPLRTALRKKIRNTIISPGFPNKAVVEAYLNPLVDDSKEPFSWAKPNLDLIHNYVRAKLGWSREKCDELLLPVLKKMEENSSQSTLDKHFKIIQKESVTDGILSKRVETAIKRLGGCLEETEEPDTEVVKKKRRKNTIAKKTADSLKNYEETTEESSEQKTETKRREKTSAETPNPCQKTEKIFSSLTVNGKSVKESRGNSKDFSKIKAINAKLHQDVKVPQKEMSQKFLEQKKEEAIRIFRTFKKDGKKKTKVYAKEKVKLSESSSEDD